MGNSSGWHEADKDHACPICGKADWCGHKIDGNAVRCMRIAEPPPGWRVVERDHHGGTTFAPLDSPGYLPPSATGTADPETLDRVYRALLAGLQLSPEHRDNLRQRGLTDAQIDAGRYRTLGRDRWRAVRGLVDGGLGDLLLSVPGFSWDEEKNRFKLGGRNGILIPVRDHLRRIIALKIRADEAGAGGRYSYLSSRKQGGPGPGSPVHLPHGTPERCDVVRITEGELKADVAFAITGTPTISLPGVSSWQKALPEVARLGAHRVLVAFDSDAREKPQVGHALRRLVAELRKAGVTVEIENWDATHKGVDDLLASGGSPGLLTGDDIDAHLARLPTMAADDQCESGDGRIEIVDSPECHEVNAATMQALAERDDTLYQRHGLLVTVVRQPAATEKGICRPEGAPRIHPIAYGVLRERISRTCRFKRRIGTRDGGVQEKRIAPPASVVSAIHTRGAWDDFRPLNGVTTCPVLRPDGTILSQAGYDAATGLILLPDRDWPEVPSHPTNEDVKAAVAALREVFCDFPFATPAHEAAAICIPLTLASRDAFDGPAPLFLTDAPCAGSGKTLAADAATMICTGLPLARTVFTPDDNEFRKRITALVEAGDRAVLIDNVAVPLGCPSLDACLTSTRWKDRALGENRMIDADNRITWLATGNNVELKGDTGRRTLHIRLLTEHERPEEREGFRHPNLTAYVKQDRPRLLTAALTILRGYVASGRPDQGLKPWGSFEAWSDLVRSAVVWAGLSDPCETRQELVSSADLGRAGAQAFLACWEAHLTSRKGGWHSAADAIRYAKSLEDDDFRQAIVEFAPGRKTELPTARSLGKKLAGIKDRILGGRVLKSRSIDGTFHWKVEPVKTPTKEPVEESTGFTGFTGNAQPATREKVHISSHQKIGCDREVNAQWDVPNPVNQGNPGAYAGDGYPFED